MADRYWVGGAGNWNTSNTTNWSTTSGGTGGASVPTSSDNVFFDANSGSGAVLAANGSNRVPCLDFDTTGYTGSFDSDSSGVQAHGNVVATAAADGLFEIELAGTSKTANWNSANLSNMSVTVSGSYTFLSGGTFFHVGDRNPSGTLNTGGYAITCQYISFGRAGSNLDITNSTITLTGRGPSGADDTFLFLGSTLTTTGSTLQFQCSTSGTISLVCVQETFSTIVFAGSNANTLSLFGGITIGTLQTSRTADATIRFQRGATTSIGTFSVSGSSAHTITIESTTSNSIDSLIPGHEDVGTHTINKTTAGYVESDYLNIQNSIATPDKVWLAGDNSVNNQSVAPAGSGWYFTSLPSYTVTNATLGRVGGSFAEIYADNTNASFVKKGIVYNTSTFTPADNVDPSTLGVSASEIFSDVSDGQFVAKVIDILPDTTYYARAYASTAVNTKYSSELTFTTDKLAIINNTTTLTNVTNL